MCVLVLLSHQVTMVYYYLPYYCGRLPEIISRKWGFLVCYGREGTMVTTCEAAGHIVSSQETGKMTVGVQLLSPFHSVWDPSYGMALPTFTWVFPAQLNVFVNALTDMPTVCLLHDSTSGQLDTDDWPSQGPHGMSQQAVFLLLCYLESIAI